MNHHFYSAHLFERKTWLSSHSFPCLLFFQKQKFKAIRFLKICFLITALLSLHVLKSSAQTKKITGKVSDELGAPVIGASIKIKGTAGGTVTNIDGNFSLSAAPKTSLTVSAIGFETIEVVVGDVDKLNVQLKAKENSLNEVVVTALGIKRDKRELTYSTQQVTGDQLTASKEPGILNSLDGKVAGVQINTSSGAPGSSTSIIIRGNSSLTGNEQALIVLDGVPINNYTTTGSGQGPGISRLSDIDPSTVESINVLKGSAASALYGSEAARGVVIITTKSGAANTKPKVTLNSQYSFENAILPKLQDKYALGDKGVYADGSSAQQTSLVWGPLISDLVAKGTVTFNSNPLKDFFVTGKTFTNTASVSGGTERTGYFLSASNLTQDGTVPTAKYGRNTFFGKFNNKLSDKVSIGFQMNYTQSNAHSIPEGVGLTAPLWTLLTAPYTYNFLPYLNADGTQRLFRAARNNPYWALNNIYTNEKINRFTPTFSLSYNPVSWITITERLGLDSYSEQVDYYEAPSTLTSTLGTINQRNNNFRQINNDLIIEGRKTFNDFNVSLLLGNNIRDTYTQLHSITGSGTTILGFDNIANGSTISATQSYVESRKIGFYAQSNIGYKDFLNLSLTGRYDGTSVLSLDHAFYPYGSASLGFLFGELLKVPAINFAKLRVSYSAVGNDNVSAYANSTAYSSAGNPFPLNGNAGFLLGTSLGNPNLKNESTNEGEVGLEMNLLKNRISFEASYFDRHHDNLLTSVTLPYSSGYTNTVLNVGNMTNKGFEALLNITPVKSRNFSYDIKLNWTKIYNKVTKVNTLSDRIAVGTNELIVGQPFGVIYNTGYQRSADGQILIDNTGLPMYTSGSIVIGNTQPKYQAGMTNTLKYKNFTFSFFLDYKVGGQVLNSDDRYGFFYGTPKATESREDRVVEGIVASTGLPNTTVVTAENYYQRLNSIYEAAVQDATFLKLRYASIGYNLPQKMLLKTPFSTASFTVTGRNLFIYAPHFTGSDPEVSSNGTGTDQQGYYAATTPTSRSFNFSLNLTFK